VVAAIKGEDTTRRQVEIRSGYAKILRMTKEENRSTKAHLLLDLRETEQILDVRCGKLKAWAKDLEVLGRRLGEGKVKFSAAEESLFDLAALKALLSEIAELSKKRTHLDARARALGL
jgi:hypothetical protein